MKKILMLVALLAVGWNCAVAKSPRFERVESELGEDLGFWVFKASADLSADEIFVVTETFTTEKDTLVADWYTVSRGKKAEYRVVMVDSSAFVPKSFNICFAFQPRSIFLKTQFLRSKGVIAKS